MIVEEYPEIVGDYRDKLNNITKYINDCDHFWVYLAYSKVCMCTMCLLEVPVKDLMLDESEMRKLWPRRYND